MKSIRLSSILTLAILFFFSWGQAQTITMTGTPGGSNTYTGCTGTFEDAGGAGAYPNTIGTFTQVICAATADDIVHLEFGTIDLRQGGAGGNDDDIRIYSGNGTGGPLLFDAPPDYFASDVDFYGPQGGCITIVFIQNGTNNGPAPGWSAGITCLNTTTTPVYSGPTTTACSGYFVDPGGITGYMEGGALLGGGTGYYANSAQNHYTICPCNPGTYVTLDFQEFNIENGFERMTILDGGLSGGIIGTYTGNAGLPPSVTSSSPDGCLTLVFSGDASYTAPGWLATIGNSATPGNNTYCCSFNNCSGGCGTWICTSGEFDAQVGAGDGCAEDLRTNTTRGCTGANGEVNSNWFYFSPETSGTLYFTIAGPNGLDFDYAIWLSPVDGEIACPLNTNQAPIRCSYSAINGGTGLNTTALDFSEGAAGDGFTAQMNVTAGQTFSMLLNVFSSGNPQAKPTWTWGGSATLSCTPDGGVLPVEFGDFYGRNFSEGVELKWNVPVSDMNDYFQVMRGTDPYEFKAIGVVAAEDQVGHYSFIDEHLENGIYYYKVIGYEKNGSSSSTSVLQMRFDNADEAGRLVKIVNLLGVDVTSNPPAGQVLIKVFSNGKTEKYIVQE